jgi:hypothetical protein
MSDLTNETSWDFQELIIKEQINNRTEYPPEMAQNSAKNISDRDNQDDEDESTEKSTLRALELSRKGIFACPQIIRFFCDDEDKVRIR